MGIGLSFQRNKVNRLIRQFGANFDVKRKAKNEYGEPIEGGEETFAIVGVFHETSAFVSKTATDGSTTRSKPQPMILCSLEDGKKLKRNDEINFKDKIYKVVEIKKPCEYDVCFDVSLEVVQDG